MVKSGTHIQSKSDHCFRIESSALSFQLKFIYCRPDTITIAVVFFMSARWPQDGINIF